MVPKLPEMDVAGADPPLHILVHSLPFQLVRSEACFDANEYKGRSYRTRRKAAVHLRNAGTGEMFLLWEGRWSRKDFNANSDRDLVFWLLRLTDEMVDEIAPGHTVAVV